MSAVFVCDWRYVKGSLDNCSEAKKCNKECALRRYEVKTESEDMLALKDLEMTCEEEELTPDEMARVAEGERELKAGLGVKYEQSIWDDLEDEEVDKIYEELYLSHTGSS